MGMMKPEFRSIVVFGGAGFIGSNWTERLLRTTEAKVHVFDNLSRQGARHNLEHLQKMRRPYRTVADHGGRRARRRNGQPGGQVRN